MLSVEKLNLQKNGKKIFTDLSFSLFLGASLLLTGKNGSGKTSLLKILAGISKQSSGKIIWGEENIENFRPDFNGDLQFLGHKNFLQQDLTLWQNLHYWASLSGCQDSLSAALRYFKIDHLMDEKVKNLSAGMQKRALLAKTMAHPTTIWLLDEPETNLDQEGRALLRDLIKTRLENHAMIIISTHNPDLYDKAARLNLEDFR